MVLALGTSITARATKAVRALGWLEIALAPALLAVFAYRVINLWLPIIPALAGLPTLRRLEQAGRRPARGTA